MRTLENFDIVNVKSFHLSSIVNSWMIYGLRKLGEFKYSNDHLREKPSWIQVEKIILKNWRCRSNVRESAPLPSLHRSFSYLIHNLLQHLNRNCYHPFAIRSTKKAVWILFSIFCQLQQCSKKGWGRQEDIMRDHRRSRYYYIEWIRD